jgi:hypothetical protein
MRRIIASSDFAGFSPSGYEQRLYEEFEQLYEERPRRADDVEHPRSSPVQQPSVH